MANNPNPADFTPSIPDFPAIGTFQPIYGKFDLTTYIQGASDYEIMSFLVQCYNKTLTGYSEVTQLSKDTVTAYNQLQTWVNTWFENVDIHDEAIEVLNRMESNGTLQPIISASIVPALSRYMNDKDGQDALKNSVDYKLTEMYANGDLAKIVAETNQAYAATTAYLNTVEGQETLANSVKSKLTEMGVSGELSNYIGNSGDIQKSTTEWLTQNVTPTGSAVSVDFSLSIKGSAADAKATGAAKDDLSFLLNNQLNNVLLHKYVTINQNGIRKALSLHKGDSITIGTVNGQTFPDIVFYIDFYDASGSRATYFGVGSQFGNTRTVTIDADAEYAECRDNVSNVNVYVLNNAINNDSIIADLPEYNFKSGNINILDNNFDLNDCVPNQIYLVSDYCKNAPAIGTLFSFANSTTAKDLIAQFLVSTDNVVFVRYKPYGGNWTGWKVLDGDYSTYAKLCIYDRVGVIGDSYAAGDIYNKDGSFLKTDHSKAWLTQLSKQNSFTPILFAASGLSTRTWLSDPNGLPLLKSESPCDLYIIALGINDYYALGESYLGVPGDIGTDIDSFYGNYSKIVREIRNKAPNAKLMLSSLAIDITTDSNSRVLIRKFNTAIQTIAKYYALPNINIDGYFDSINYAKWKYGGHPTAFAYGVMATAMEKCISKTMSKYQEYFNS